MTQAGKDTADRSLFMGFSVLLHVESGSFGIFPEMELFCWVRSDGSTSKMLTLRPKRRPNLMTTANEEKKYIADECEVPDKDIEAMARWVSQLSSWPPQIVSNPGEPDNSWWMRMMCRLELPSRFRSAFIDIGGIGFDGADAEIFRKLFERILDLAGVGDSLARKVLVGKNTDA
jgi:hypothetical protein